MCKNSNEEVTMHHAIFRRCSIAQVAVLLAGLLMWPAIGAAQTVSGQARAVQATILGATTVLADTGTLVDSDDSREAALSTGDILSLGAADVLHATTISSIYGWDLEDSVASEASVADLGLNVPGNTIAAELVMARAIAPVGSPSIGTAIIDGLSINGLPIDVTGAVNQTVSLLGGRVVINEVLSSATGTVVNALHIVLDGLADVVIASASAGITPATSAPSPDPSPTPLPLPLPLPLGL
jgi:hypothetical protein